MTVIFETLKINFIYNPENDIIINIDFMLIIVTSKEKIKKLKESVGG